VINLENVDLVSTRKIKINTRNVRKNKRDTKAKDKNIKEKEMVDIFKHFTFVKKYNEIKDLKEKVLKYTKEDWEKYDYRQKNYIVHSSTKTIPLIWNEMNKDNLRNLKKDDRKFWPEAEKYKTDLDSLSQMFTEKYGKGFISSAMLINLPSRTVIKPHVDNYDPYFDLVKRTHLAIVTDDEVIFTVGGEERNIKEGEIFEIDNSNKLHSVINNSEEIDRVHLLADWLTT
jgi:hypothetical protein|tara:strand:+ start:369 stop:1055 length:687 start_codon:yes stop_codon:yes gene_type:complete